MTNPPPHPERDLSADLRLCEAAKAPWRVDEPVRMSQPGVAYTVKAWPIVDSEGECIGWIYGDNITGSQWEVLQNAAEAWPHAIERAMRAETENARLRLLLAAAVQKGLASCPYGQSSGAMMECRLGFPGCACADDILLALDELAGALPKRLRAAEARIRELEAMAG